MTKHFRSLTSNKTLCSMEEYLFHEFCINKLDWVLKGIQLGNYKIFLHIKMIPLVTFNLITKNRVRVNPD
jgi:hypothetical protein